MSISFNPLPQAAPSQTNAGALPCVGLRDLSLVCPSNTFLAMSPPSETFREEDGTLS